MAEESKLRKGGRAFRTEGIAFAIPTVMVVFPVGGAFLGNWAGRHFGHPWLLYVGLVLGLVAGVRETVRLVKELKAIQAASDKKD
ncbi:MAG TPA: AtpZ/AtpI family protein [Candidatus Sumerlaeota bacterium]|nr:AtpZ/AtpI family protein [Candidatus Sumerlaeota bacterium]HMZ51501.1 AtpZ/AtpI family protein [Candidatus Sumerlaeota bacterium]HNM45794.1 AtpZ/AtpI family protein [Candidatus Sumerlaeota bacterium]